MLPPQQNTIPCLMKDGECHENILEDPSNPNDCQLTENVDNVLIPIFHDLLQSLT